VTLRRRIWNGCGRPGAVHGALQPDHPRHSETSQCSGQLWVLHLRASLRPGTALPPHEGCRKTERPRDWVPPLQDLLQPPQPPQAETTA